MTGRPKSRELPLLKELTRALRDLNKYADGPMNVGVEVKPEWIEFDPGWVLVRSDWLGSIGDESIPGDDKPFDAVAVARRLLSDLRDHYGL